MFEFTVPDGDWDLVNGQYVFKDLVFVETVKTIALEAFEEFVNNETAFTMVYKPLTVA